MPPVAQLRLDPERVPLPVRDLVRVLVDAGYATVLVGGCVRDLLRGCEVRDFDAATQAAPEAVLALFPRAVPIGLRHGTVMIPTASGPVDVTTLRAGPRIEDDLACRDFTVNAIAYDPIRGELLDVFDGRGDLARGRLRAVRSARDRFDEDPLRMLRAARLVATLGLEVDGEIERAMQGGAQALRGVSRERVRAELEVLLLGPQVESGLELLQRTGVDVVLASGAAPDALGVVGRLPPDLELRLACWLRGTRAAAILRGLRFARRRVERVERLLRHHPVERGVDPAQDTAVRRLIKRVGEEDIRALLALRRAEIEASGEDGGGLERLGELEDAIERVKRMGALALRRFDLALDGRAVIRQLGCRPGPVVGQALAHLTDCVVEDPACNTPERLEALLKRWWSRQSS